MRERMCDKSIKIRDYQETEEDRIGSREIIRLHEASCFHFDSFTPKMFYHFIMRSRFDSSYIIY